MNLRVIACLLLFGGLLSAATGWERLSGLGSHDVIRVIQSDHKERTGQFVSVSSQNVVVRVDGNDVPIERSNVLRVVLVSKSKRLRNALIGAGVGVVLGVAVDRTLGAYLGNEGGYSSTDQALVFMVPIALFGGVASLNPSHPTIYRAR